jgi:DNA-3-methyladenine glycosylase II
VRVNFSMSARGPFSLAAAARFQEAFPAFQGGDDAARLDLAFTADDDWTPVGVRVTGDLRGRVVANPGDVPVERIRAQVERILSLDADGTGFAEAGVRDPMVHELQQRFPGLRPVLFGTPYEAAAWALICHRIRMTQAATVKARIAASLGAGPPQETAGRRAVLGGADHDPRGRAGGRLPGGDAAAGPRHGRGL